MKVIPIGLGLFSVRRALEGDLEGTLCKVRDMGYEAVEFFGKAHDDPARVKAALAAAGLKVAGWHISIDTLSDAVFGATVAYHKAIGNKNLVVPGLPEEMTCSAAAWRATSAKMGGFVAKLAAEGMTLGYHNHHTEFAVLEGGQCAWDIMAGAPGLVLQLDNGNAMMGGADTLAMLKKYPGRGLTVHLKPYSLKDGHSTMIGEDDIPWLETFAELERQDATECALVEYEDAKYEEFEGVRLCIEALKALGKA